ncbi:hypothetical protein [Amycolatopsis anabasis]|uniref:hypothetical protein n=1 Tax=Amycolatopsis anabasis TaxID=1840409 RepID=UPI001FE745F0|nr:hypothetical protein [Amycolatopsis anabasis]
MSESDKAPEEAVNEAEPEPAQRGGDAPVETEASESKADDTDPERLLAEALRAQARSAPAHPSAPESAPLAQLAADPGPLPAAGRSEATDRTEALRPPRAIPVFSGGDSAPPPSYGLLSGADAGSLERERAALDALAESATERQRAEVTRQETVHTPVGAHWILLLAVLLGLAAGSVAGLLTLL